MSDPTRDQWTATAAGGSHSPHPALRTLWALGGGPLAFVRADEAMAERLQRLTRDVTPPLVQGDGKPIQALTTTFDLTSLSGQLIDATSDSAHEPNDANAGAPHRRRTPLSTLITQLRRKQTANPETPSSSFSAPSAPLRVQPLVAPQSAPPPHPPRTPTTTAPHAKKPNLLATALTTLSWPQATPVTAGRTSLSSATDPVRALVEGATAKSPLASLPLPSRATIREMLADYAAAATSISRHDLAATAAERLLQITERVERKVAAARATAGAGATRQAVTRRMATESAANAAAVAPRQVQPGDAAPAPDALRASGRGDAGTIAPAGAAPSFAPSFGASAEVTELRGFRGLALRAAAASDDAPTERAPMLQPIHQGRRGWDEIDAADAWSLDAAARLEGLDLDEVAS